MSISWSPACSMTSRSAGVAGSSRPALAMAWGVVEGDVEPVEGVGGLHRESAPLVGIWQLQ
jgi:hypothetical protein